MNFESWAVDRVFFVRWNASPTVADVEALERMALDAARRLGDRIVPVAVQYSLASPPPPVRDRFEKLMRNLDPHCVRSILIVEGDGVMPMLIRTVIRGTFIVTRQASRLSLAASVEEGIRIAASTLGISAGDLEVKLRACGAIRARAASA